MNLYDIHNKLFLIYTQKVRTLAASHEQEKYFCYLKKNTLCFKNNQVYDFQTGYDYLLTYKYYLVLFLKI